MCATRVSCYARIGASHSIFGAFYGLRGPASRLLTLAEVSLHLESWRADVRELARHAEEVDGTTVDRQARRRAPLPARRERRDGRHPARRPTRRPLERVSGQPHEGNGWQGVTRWKIIFNSI